MYIVHIITAHLPINKMKNIFIKTNYNIEHLGTYIIYNMSVLQAYNTYTVHANTSLRRHGAEIDEGAQLNSGGESR